MLLRGLGRIHVFPGDDAGARNNLQKWLGIQHTLDYDGTKRVVNRCILMPASFTCIFCSWGWPAVACLAQLLPSHEQPWVRLSSRRERHGDL